MNTCFATQAVCRKCASLCEPRRKSLCLAKLVRSSHGATAAGLSGYKGAEEGHSLGKGLAVLSAEDTAKYWAKLDNCATKPERTKISAKAKGGMNTEVSTFRGCQQNAQGVLYSIKGAGNTWPGGEQRMAVKVVGKTSNDFSADDVVWSFFVSRHLPAQSAPRN